MERRELKVNAGKSKLMVLNGEEGLDCEMYVNEILLEPVSEFKYLGCVLDESDTDVAECSRKVVNRWRVDGAIRFLVMLGICSLSVLVFYMKHSLYPYLCNIIKGEGMI